MSVSVEKPTPGLYSCSFPQGGSDMNGNLSVDVGYRITQVTAYRTSIFLKVR